MKKQAILLAVLAVALASCGVYGPKGNDVGGIIPWSPEAEAMALDTAQANCGRYNQFAVITSIHRAYGDYISYRCQWNASPEPVFHFKFAAFVLIYRDARFGARRKRKIFRFREANINQRRSVND